MSKIMTLAVAAGAYVLGTRAGRERYEEISSQAKKLWHDPRVQKRTSEATDLVKDQAAKVTDSGDSSSTGGAKHSGGSTGAGSASAPSGARSDVASQ